MCKRWLLTTFTYLPTYLLIITGCCDGLALNSRSFSVDNLYVCIYVVANRLTHESCHVTAALSCNCHGNVVIQPITSSYAWRWPHLNNIMHTCLMDRSNHWSHLNWRHLNWTDLISLKLNAIIGPRLRRGQDSENTVSRCLQSKSVRQRRNSISDLISFQDLSANIEDSHLSGNNFYRVRLC